MTPKEKAKEIYEKYCNMNSHCDNAKECALIAVDEIIKSRPSLPILGDGYILKDIERSAKYWQEVKQEINKLCTEYHQINSKEKKDV